jgi:hypothetical protein
MRLRAPSPQEGFCARETRTFRPAVAWSIAFAENRFPLFGAMLYRCVALGA